MQTPAAGGSAQRCAPRPAQRAVLRPARAQTGGSALDIRASPGGQWQSAALALALRSSAWSERCVQTDSATVTPAAGRRG